MYLNIIGKDKIYYMFTSSKILDLQKTTTKLTFKKIK